MSSTASERAVRVDPSEPATRSDDKGLSRQRERWIDLAATALLLSFAWLFRQDTPGLSGVVIAAAIQFWLVKNATRAR